MMISPSGYTVAGRGAEYPDGEPRPGSVTAAAARA